MTNDFIIKLAIGLPGFLMAIVFHEAAHAFMAYRFGDTTARDSGRLTLNPVAHMDPIGTIVFPLILVLLNFAPFGWARPVPVNANRFKNVRAGIFWVSFAGPGMNIILGTLCALAYGVVATQLSQDFYLYRPLLLIFGHAVSINFVLAVFNLLPIPPLDGSQMVTAFLSYEGMRKYESVAKYGHLFFLLLLFPAVGGFLSGVVFGPAQQGAQFLIGFFIQLLA